MDHSHPAINEWEESLFREHVAEFHGATGLFVNKTSATILQEWHARRHNEKGK